MYPSSNDNRYPDSLSNPDPYSNQLRMSGMQMINMNHRPSYYEQPNSLNTMMQPPTSSGYDYMPPNYMMPSMNQGLVDPRYPPNWRQSSENRNSNVNMLPPYYERSSMNMNMGLSDNYSSHTVKPIHLNYPETYQHQHHEPLSMRSQQPQMNILQRLSFIIKPQLPELKKIMSRVTSHRKQKQRRREKSRQRSRSHEKNRKSTVQWVCQKCSFLNFDWRDKCKKCNQNKPSKSFAPGPEDWRCSKCNNLNYARRFQCNRCKTPRGK